MSIGSGVFDPGGSKNRGVPLTRLVALTTVLHYRADCDNPFLWSKAKFDPLLFCTSSTDYTSDGIFSVFLLTNIKQLPYGTYLCSIMDNMELVVWPLMSHLVP